MLKIETFKDCRLFDRNCPVTGSRDKYGRRKFGNAERNLNRILQIVESSFRPWLKAKHKLHKHKTQVFFLKGKEDTVPSI